MSAEVLRRAAALMRERAEAASPGQWRFTDSEAVNDVWEGGMVVVNLEGDPIANVQDEWYENEPGEPAPINDAEHIASWHPAVALAVAKLLDRTADDHDQWWGVRAACRDLDMAGEETDEGIVCDCSYKDCYEHGKWHNCTHGQPDLTSALTVARAYLGESS